MKGFVCGHKIPDSDSIVGAIAYAHLKNEQGNEFIPVRQGDLNPESEFILNRFNLASPIFKDSFSSQNLYLIDHCDRAQAPSDLDEANLLGIIDHHKLGDITTPNPLECWIRPIGSSNTVIKQIYDFFNIKIPSNIAGAMLCAILSDTVIFKSPTCTKDDVKAAKDLAKIAGIEDMKALGMEMFEVKSNIGKASAHELLMRDYKEFNMGGKTIAIGQLELVDLGLIEPRKDELKDAIKAHKGDKFGVVLLLTDILKNGSLVLLQSDDDASFGKAFGLDFVNGEAWYDKCMSRKKQVVPPLEKFFG